MSEKFSSVTKQPKQTNKLTDSKRDPCGEIKKQKAYGPHHFPEKQFQSINTFAQSNAKTLREKFFFLVFENRMVEY